MTIAQCVDPMSYVYALGGVVCLGVAGSVAIMTLVWCLKEVW